MLLSTEDTYSSDVEMLGGEQSEEHIQSDTEINIVEEVKLMADESLICSEHTWILTHLGLTMKRVH